MKRSFKTSARLSVLLGTLSVIALPFSMAEAALYWPPITDDGSSSGGSSSGGSSGGGVDPGDDYNQGYADGEAAGKESCQLDPSSCGISLQGFLDNLGYGETEPNDKAFSADGLVLEQTYHANSFDYFDEDWYYVTTTVNNQNITVSFLGDATSSGIFAPTDGWIVSIRDSAGNILATFNSASPGQGEGEDTTQGREMTMTAGNPGTYYITVQPLEEETGVSGGTYKAYNIAAMLSDPGQTSPNPDSNFMDAELEPNDIRSQATALSSTTNMFAYFDKTAVGGSAIGAFNFDSDWFVYGSGGNEILNLRMCARESCGRSEQPEVQPLTTEFTRIWHLQISNAAGQVLIDGPIQPGQSVNAALTFADEYYIHFGTEATGEVECATGATIEECPSSQIVSIVYDASGAYNFTVTGTDLSPSTP